jgi:hypothetical protein
VRRQDIAVRDPATDRSNVSLEEAREVVLVEQINDGRRRDGLCV